MVYFDSRSCKSDVNDVDCFVHILYVTPPFIIFSMWVFLFFIMISPPSSFAAVFIVLLTARYLKKKELDGLPVEYSKKMLGLKEYKILKQIFTRISVIRTIGGTND